MLAASGGIMTLKENARVGEGLRPAPRGIPVLPGLLGAAVVFVAVLSSCFVAILPAFRFESQFPAVLPLFLWAAAAGAGHLATFGRLLLDPWRAAFGLPSLVPWAVVLAIPMVARHVALPWWSAPVAAFVAAVPFVVAALRPGGEELRLVAERQVSGQSLRGTFLVGIATMALVWAVGGPPVVSTIVGVLLALALGVGALLPHGLALATRTWRLRNWASLAWGSALVWLTIPLSATTRFFADPWYLAASMVVAGLPLVLVNRADAQAPPPPADAA